jgi:hypothetical protein
MGTKSSFYGDNEVVYTDTNPPGPADAPLPTSPSNAPSSFYQSGEVYQAADLAAQNIEQVEEASAAAVAAAETATAAEAATLAAKETGFGLSISVPGIPLLSSEWLFGHKFDVAVTFALNLAGSQAAAGGAATGSPVISLQKNGVQFATLTYTGTTGTFSGSQTSFAIGDLLEAVAPASPDATLSHLSITLFASRD